MNNGQSNPAPWVVLALIVMTGCLVSGMILGNVGVFNSRVAEANIPVQQTQGALVSGATQTAAAISLTQQAPAVEQTAIAGAMTTAPLQQAATQAAAAYAVQVSQANATQTALAGQMQNQQLMAQADQTAIANDLYVRQLKSNATATALAQGQAARQAGGIAGLSVLGIGLLVAFGWIVARTVTLTLIARAQEQAARAKLLDAQRQLAIERSSEQAQRRTARSEYPLPLSLIQKINGGRNRDLPHVE